MAASMPRNVVIVGLGNIGNTHARVYSEHPDCAVIAVCDIIEERAKEAARRFNCQAFTSVDEMLAANLSIDFASVCSAGEENGGDHYKPTMQLLGAGIPVLGEKPISNRIQEAEEMVALAKKQRVRYGVNLNHRFTPAALRLKEWQNAGRLGTINMVNMTMWINNPNESSPYFHMRALHPHSIDVMRYFCGDVAKVQAFLKKGEGRNIWSNAQVNMQFKNGTIGHLTGSYDAGGSYGLERLELIGSEARVILRDACEQLEFYPRRSQQVERYSYLGGMMKFPETFDSRIGRWVEQNLDSASPDEIDASGEEALKAQRVIEAAITSWETGKVVEL